MSNPIKIKIKLQMININKGKASNKILTSTYTKSSSKNSEQVTGLIKIMIKIIKRPAV